jgi:hypothetical protein
MGWEKLKRPPESQYLAPSDFYLYVQLKKSTDVHELKHKKIIRQHVLYFLQKIRNISVQRNNKAME